MNAKDEFIEYIEAREVLRAVLYTSEYVFILKDSYSELAYRSFLEDLDFEYNDGFGRQMLFGVIWYTDGTWSERYEYDGSECWSHKTIPKFDETKENAEKETSYAHK
jgi:hypothetical protein